MTIDIDYLRENAKPRFKNHQEALEAVRQDSNTLRFVDKQTPEICLEAVQENGLALQYVREQTPEICMAAVKQNSWALQHVHEQTPEICLAAVQKYRHAISYVNPAILSPVDDNPPRTVIIDGIEYIRKA